MMTRDDSFSVDSSLIFVKIPEGRGEEEEGGVRSGAALKYKSGASQVA